MAYQTNRKPEVLQRFDGATGRPPFHTPACRKLAKLGFYLPFGSAMSSVSMFELHFYTDFILFVPRLFYASLPVNRQILVALGDKQNKKKMQAKAMNGGGSCVTLAS